MGKSGFSRRRLLAILAGALPAAAGIDSLAKAAEPNQEGTADARIDGTKKPRRKSKQDWGLLNFYVILPDPDRRDNPESHRIKRIKISLSEKNNAPWDLGWAGDKPLLYETQDPGVLETIEDFLRHPLRLALGQDYDCDSEGGIIVGRVLVTTNQEKFMIGISMGAFLLGDNVPHMSRVFYSWGLAHFLDDLVARHAGIRIPPEALRSLSGESRMDNDRESLRKLNERMKADTERNRARPSPTR
jgi:hypothetical protein